jgi:hypothetical protein
VESAWKHEMVSPQQKKNPAHRLVAPARWIRVPL